MKRFVSCLMFVVLGCCLLFTVGCKEREEGRTEYFIDAVFDGEKSLDCKMTVDYINDTETEITELKFNLFPSAFREGARNKPVSAGDVAKAYPLGVNYGGIEITGCNQEGRQSEWKIGGEDSNILVLRLKNGVFPSERAVVEINFKLSLPICNLRFGIAGDRINLGNWYPILCARDESGFYECNYSAFGDPFFADVADYVVKLTVPGDFSVAAGGECTLTEVGEKFTAYTYSLPNYRDVAFVLCKGFNVLAGEADGVEILFYYKDFSCPEKVVDAAEKAVETFGELFGKYPYYNLAIAQTPFLQGGMEYSSLCYLADGIPEEEAITVAVHETAHQWWYGAVGNNQTECAYIDEGLAEYSTSLFYQNNPSYGMTREGIIKDKNAEFRAFYGVYQQLNGTVDTAMERNLKDFNGEYEYVEICYTKSLLMLDGLRQSVGDARFFKGLKRLYSDNEWGIVGTDEFIAAFEKGGSKAEGYINSWLTGKAII